MNPNDIDVKKMVPEELFEVPVMQFLMPNGRMNATSTRLPVTSKNLFDEMIVAGCRFEAEMLRTGEISVTISRGEDDVDISVTGNGPEVQSGMVEMLSRKLWK